MKNTRVYLRHFKERDFERSLAEKRILKATPVLSIFPWKESSPKKRKPPTARVRKDVDASGISEVCKGSQEDMADISENAPSTSAQCDAVDIALEEDVLPEEITSDLRLRNQDLERQLNEEKAKTRALESQINNLQTKVSDLTKRCQDMEKESFSFSRFIPQLFWKYIPENVVFKDYGFYTFNVEFPKSVARNRGHYP